MIKFYSRIKVAYLRLVWRLLIPHFLKKIGVNIGSKTVFLGWPIITMADNSAIQIGHRVVLCSDPEFTALGVRQPCVLRTLHPGASIRIGDDSGLSGVSICAATSIEIGDGCLIGAGALLADTDFHSTARLARRYCTDLSQIHSSPIKIGSNVFIGTNAIILKGVHIGDDAVVGAGAVVVKNVQPGTIVAGNPARFIAFVSAGKAQ